MQISQRMYLFTRNWFEYQGDMTMQLWVAPAPGDLEFMTCMSCAEGYACAPGIRNGAHIILIDSSLLGGKNSDKDRDMPMPSKSFDVVISHGCLHLIFRDEWMKVLNRIKMATASGGYDIAVVFTHKVPSVRYMHYTAFPFCRC